MICGIVGRFGIYEIIWGILSIYTQLHPAYVRVPPYILRKIINIYEKRTGVFSRINVIFIINSRFVLCFIIPLLFCGPRGKGEKYHKDE